MLKKSAITRRRRDYCRLCPTTVIGSRSPFNRLLLTERGTRRTCTAIHQDGCHARHLPSPEKSHGPSGIFFFFLFIDQLSASMDPSASEIRNTSPDFVRQMATAIIDRRPYPTFGRVTRSSYYILSAPLYPNSIAVHLFNLSNFSLHAASTQSLSFSTRSRPIWQPFTILNRSWQDAIDCCQVLLAILNLFLQLLHR